MPVYLVHGFRWPRSAIRRHVILNNIDDAAPEYIVSPKASAALLESFHELYPDIMNTLPKLRFVEQYDPHDVSDSALSQPHAFVADKVELCHLSLDVTDTMEKGVGQKGWDALWDLREQLAPGQKLGWWIVYNGDESREGEGKGDAVCIALRYREIDVVCLLMLRSSSDDRVGSSRDCSVNNEQGMGRLWYRTTPPLNQPWHSLKVIGKTILE